MVNKYTYNILFILLMLTFLATENKAHIVESPSPQPQKGAYPPTYGAEPGSLHPQECGGRCVTRCSKTAFKKPCMFFCQKCCAKCLCVPPGTYGNKQLCPCYIIIGRPKEEDPNALNQILQSKVFNYLHVFSCV